MRATGDVTLNNDVILRDVYANGTVNMQGDAKVVERLVGLGRCKNQQGFAGSGDSNGNIMYHAVPSKWREPHSHKGCRAR